MPLTPGEAPDMDVHRNCTGCNQWCRPEEGRELTTSNLRRLDHMADVAGLPRVYFLCHACRRRSNWQVVWLILTAAGIIGIALAYRTYYAP